MLRQDLGNYDDVFTCFVVLSPDRHSYHVFFLTLIPFLPILLMDEWSCLALSWLAHGHCFALSHQSGEKILLLVRVLFHHIRVGKW